VEKWKGIIGMGVRAGGKFKKKKKTPVAPKGRAFRQSTPLDNRGTNGRGRVGKGVDQGGEARRQKAFGCTVWGQTRGGTERHVREGGRNKGRPFRRGIKYGGENVVKKEKKSYIEE